MKLVVDYEPQAPVSERYSLKDSSGFSRRSSLFELYNYIKNNPTNIQNHILFLKMSSGLNEDQRALVKGLVKPLIRRHNIDYLLDLMEI